MKPFDSCPPSSGSTGERSRRENSAQATGSFLRHLASEFDLIAALRMLANKRDINPPKKHGNIPL